MNGSKPLKCWAERDAWDPFSRIRIMIGGKTDAGKIVRMDPVMFSTMDEDDAVSYSDASNRGLLIESETAQSLMDQLWNLGIRPTEGHGSTGQLAATERHLEDLRALVFKEVPPRGAISTS